MNLIFDLFRSPGLVGLGVNVLTVWAVLAVSILVLSRNGSDFGSDTSGAPRSAPWTPPGPAIGAVWAVLYTLMAVAAWGLNKVPAPDAATARIAIIALIGFCIIWPFYAFDTKSRWPGLLGNLAILVLALFAISQLWTLATAAALLIVPVALWITVRQPQSSTARGATVGNQNASQYRGSVIRMQSDHWKAGYQDQCSRGPGYQVRDRVAVKLECQSPGLISTYLPSGKSLRRRTYGRLAMLSKYAGSEISA